MRTVAVILSLLAVLAAGCTTTTPDVGAALDQKVTLVCSQTLLRDVVAEFDAQAKVHVRIESRLNEIADLGITYRPKRHEDQQIPLSIALDIVKWQVVNIYHVPVDWRVDKREVMVFFAGSDDDYKQQRLRDK